MNIDKLAARITKLEGGKVKLSNAQIKEVIRCLNDQVLDDTGGEFDLYSMLHCFKEPDESDPEGMIDVGL